MSVEVNLTPEDKMKTNRLNKTLAQQYRNRWQQVAQIERQEQQAASYQQRWIQLNNLWRLAAGLTLLSAPNETVVWQRWARLKEGLE
jgi:hypothetical protein